MHPRESGSGVLDADETALLSMDGSSLFGYPDMSDSEEMRLLINWQGRV